MVTSIVAGAPRVAAQNGTSTQIRASVEVLRNGASSRVVDPFVQFVNMLEVLEHTPIEWVFELRLFKLGRV